MMGKAKPTSLNPPVRLLLTVQNNFGFPLRDFCMQKASCNYTRLFRKKRKGIYTYSHTKDINA